MIPVLLLKIVQYSARFDVALVDYNLPDTPKGKVIDEVARLGILSVISTGYIADEGRDFVWSKQVVDYVPKNDPNCYITMKISPLRSTHIHQ